MPAGGLYYESGRGQSALRLEQAVGDGLAAPARPSLRKCGARACGLRTRTDPTASASRPRCELQGLVRDGLAAPALPRADDRVADLGGSVAVLERRAVRSDVRVVGDGGEEVVQLVDERVAPADDVPRRPPVLPEGMGRLRDEDCREAARA